MRPSATACTKKGSAARRLLVSSSPRFRVTPFFLAIVALALQPSVAAESQGGASRRLGGCPNTCYGKLVWFDCSRGASASTPRPSYPRALLPKLIRHRLRL